MTELVDETRVCATVIVARAPVVDAARVIVGFELVTRSTDDEAAAREQIDLGAVITPHNVFGTVDVNISPLVGDKLLFATVHRDAVMGDALQHLPPRRLVIRVPTDRIRSDYLARIRDHAREGFTIMVDHGDWEERGFEHLARELLAMASLVRIDLASGTPDEIAAVVEHYRKAPVELLAAGCDTQAQIEWAREAGFHFFMGRAVQGRPPASAKVSAIAPMPMSQMRLGVELLGRDLDVHHVEEILKGDPALVIQLLNMASSGAGGGLRRQVRSLREALVFMGTVRLRQWAALVVLSRHAQHHSDVLMTALVRARMCELLAPSRGINASYAFTAGLLSAMDLLLGVSVEEIEEEVKVDEELADAAFRRQGAEGELINQVQEYERFLVGPEALGDHDQVVLVAAQAFAWATSYVDAMEQASRADH